MLKDKSYIGFKKFLEKSNFSGQVIDNPLQRLAFSVNASAYHMIPKLVVKVKTEQDVIMVLKKALDFKLPFTFRAAGTSLSGQCLSDSILIQIDHTWMGLKIEGKGEIIKAQVGLTGAQVNNALRSFKKKIGPDPSSLSVAQLGGIAANNAKGNCCRLENDTYSTLEGLRVILYDGTILDSRDKKSCSNFLKVHSDLLNKLFVLGHEVKNNALIRQKIEHKYRIRNTVGLTLKALVDYSDPISILIHLMIGSEGTLGFISEISYRTLENAPYRGTAFLFFKNREEASKSVILLKECSVEAVEFMNDGLIEASQMGQENVVEIPELPQGSVILLVEVAAMASDELIPKIENIKEKLKSIELLFPLQFSFMAKEREQLWALRKGAFAIASRKKLDGTSMIIEDIVVPIHSLSSAILDIEELLNKYGYEKIVYGHALFGNLHMMFSIDFEKDKASEHYDEFMKGLFHIVVEKYDGSMKGEHGTGRNVSPFVEKEWGKECYQLMEEIKKLFDPYNLLNPGVIFNKDKLSYLKNIQKVPMVDPLIDHCIECGFCEFVCPSKNLTLTPRQRIAVAREMHREKSFFSKGELRKLKKDYLYEGIKTCATVGLCGIKCPIGIDSGEYIKKIKKQRQSLIKRKLALLFSHHFFLIENMTKFVLFLYHFWGILFGYSWPQKFFTFLRGKGLKKLPFLNPFLPKSLSKKKFESSLSRGKPVIYFPSCVERIMGKGEHLKEEKELPEVLFSILEKAGHYPIIPTKISSLCCGKLFESKGFEEASKNSLQLLEKELKILSKNGQIPIICNTTPCTKNLILGLDKNLKVYDSVQFINKFLKEDLSFIKKKKKVALHFTCSTKVLNIKEDIFGLASLCAEEITVPQDIECCGFAGDKGFFYPELNKNALSTLKEQIPKDITAGYSQSMTCELGLTYHSNCHYRSTLYLIDESTSVELKKV